MVLIFPSKSRDDFCVLSLPSHRRETLKRDLEEIMTLYRSYFKPEPLPTRLTAPVNSVQFGALVDSPQSLIHSISA
jgi:hypothetical protein